MNNLAVGFLAVSSTKQGLQGDSPETQRNKINLLAAKRNLTIPDDAWFEFWESRAYEKQPLDQAIDYCIKNKINYLLVVSFERATRAGQEIFAISFRRAKKHGIIILDYDGVAGTEIIDTMQHLGGGFAYSWSKINPTEERVYKRVQDAFIDRLNTLNRLIPKEIEYERLGYWMGGDINYGYTTIREDTEHGKRALAVPLEKEAFYIRKLYDLKQEARLTDKQIVEEINNLGYVSKIKKKRHPEKNKKNIIVGYTGGVKLTIKKLYDNLLHKL